MSDTNQERAGRGATGDSLPEVTVVIPAYHGKATIVACVASVQQAARDWKHEIVVVDSSGDGTVALVREVFPAVLVVASPTRLTAGQARNTGILRARGQWILCVDQDCTVPADWVERLVGLLRRPGVGAAGGSIAVANSDNLSGWCVYFLEFLYHFPRRWGRVRRDNFLIGANSAWRTEVLAGTTFPDQTLGEDRLLSEAVRRAGHEVLYDPSLTVQHQNRRGWREFGRYCRAMGTAAAKDHTRLGGFWIRRIRQVPLLVYGIPLLMLPFIGSRLLGAPPGYLLRYLLLLPQCLMGQFIWAEAFRRALQAGSVSSDR